MQKWLVRFIGYTVQKPGVELPREIYQDIPFDANNEEEAGQIVTALSLQLLAQGAMVVPRNHNQTIRDTSTLQAPKRMIVPMHMIGKIEHTAKQLTVIPSVMPELAQFDTDDVPKPSVN